MTWGMVGAAAVTVVGGAISANKASKAQQKGNNAAIGEQARQYDQTRADQLPWLEAGGSALTQMQRLNAGDYSSFQASPDYQFAMQQGIQGLDRSAAARGGLYSGGHSADLMKFGQGLATQNYGNYYNRLAGLANVGQTSANSLGQFGQSMANNIGNLQVANGQARASTYGAYGQGLAGLAGAVNYGYQRNAADSGGSGWYLGNKKGPG